MIPRSQGVAVGRTTETGLAPKSIAQAQVVPNAIANLGATISSIGFNKLQQEQLEQRKTQEEFQATQALDFRNQARRFDNEKSIELSELPDDPEVINTAKQRILEERQAFFEEIAPTYGEDKRLQKALKQEFDTSQVDFEYGLDKELLRKKKNYNTNRLYSSIADLKDRFETASSEEEFAQIGNDLNTTLRFGLSSGIINAKDIDRQQDAFRELRKERALELQRDILFNKAIEGTLKLDPTNKDDRDIIDDNYEAAVIKGADPRQLADSLAINQGVIPSQAKKYISASLFNGTNSQKLDSAVRIQSLIEKHRSQFSRTSRFLIFSGSLR